MEKWIENYLADRKTTLKKENKKFDPYIQLIFLAHVLEQSEVKYSVKMQELYKEIENFGREEATYVLLGTKSDFVGVSRYYVPKGTELPIHIEKFKLPKECSDFMVLNVHSNDVLIYVVDGKLQIKIYGEQEDKPKKVRKRNVK